MSEDCAKIGELQTIKIVKVVSQKRKCKTFSLKIRVQVKQRGPIITHAKRRNERRYKVSKILCIPLKSIQQTSSSCVYDLSSPLRATTSLSPSHISLLSHSNLSRCHGEQATRFVRVWGSVIFRCGIHLVRSIYPATNSVEKAREERRCYTLGDSRMQQIQYLKYNVCSSTFENLKSLKNRI